VTIFTGEAHDLGPADVRWHRQRVGIGDEVHERRSRMVEGVLERDREQLAEQHPEAAVARHRDHLPSRVRQLGADGVR